MKPYKLITIDKYKYEKLPVDWLIGTFNPRMIFPQSDINLRELRQDWLKLFDDEEMYNCIGG
jgi:hypothetical protein